MKSMLRRFEPVELSAEEMEESLIYVCYDRVIYHFFKRNLGIRNFSWLFSDRYWGFHYSEANEPVQPVHNGLASIVDALGEHVSVSPLNLGKRYVQDLRMAGKPVRWSASNVLTEALITPAL